MHDGMMARPVCTSEMILELKRSVNPWGCAIPRICVCGLLHSSYDRTMRALRKLLSDTLAVFLRLSACNTTSSYPLTAIEESTHHSLFEIPDQRSQVSDDEAVPAPTMSPPPHIVAPSSYLQSSFDLTLREYSKQTGIDLIGHPFAASFDNLDSVDTAIAALRERTPVSSDSQDDSIALLMNQLKSITHIVSLLSPTEALRGYIDSVCPGSLIHTFYPHAL